MAAPLAFAAACGGAAPASPPAASPAPTPAPAAPSAPPAASRDAPSERAAIAWKDMRKEERAQYMKDVVVPRMGALFRAFDSKTFATFDCATCHGAGATDGSFAMPNPALPPLPGNPMGFQALAREKPGWMKFMGREVRPQMAALLGLEEIDMRNPKPDAFGCKNCHATGGAPAAKMPAAGGS